MKAKLYKIFSVLAVFFFCLTTFTASAGVDISKGTKFYLKTSSNWREASAKFSVYFFNNSTGKNDWVQMTKVSGSTDTYEVTSPNNTFKNLIFCRMNPNGNQKDWSGVWAQTADLEYDGCRDMYNIVGWNSGSYWSKKNPEGFVTGNGTSGNPWCGGKSWDTTNSKMDANGSITFSKVPAGTYEFKVVYGCDWLGFEKYNASGSNITCSDNGGNIKFTTTGCADITIKYANSKITVNVTEYPTKYYLKGIAGNDKIEMTLQGSEYVLLNQSVKSTDVVKVSVESGCGNAEYTALKSSTKCGEEVTGGIGFDADGKYDFYFDLSNNQLYVGANASNPTKYLIMGDFDNWTNGIEITDPNPKNANEVMLECVEFTSDAQIKIKEQRLCEADWVNTVKDGSVVDKPSENNNITIKKGVYSFYYDFKNKQVYIGKPTPTKYLVMGIKGDWTTGIEMVKNKDKDKDNEYMLIGQCINKSKDAIKFVKEYSCEAREYFNSIDSETKVSYTTKNGNIVLENGVYDFYFNIKDNDTYIGYSTPKEAYLVGLDEDKKMTYNSKRNQYELTDVAVKSTDNVKAKLVYDCGYVEYVALEGGCGTVKSTADGLTFKKDGNYDFYFKLDKYQFYVEANATNKTKYLLMGVNTDWDNGIELVKNPDNGSEWMVQGVEINAERDAVQIVTKDLCREDDAFCNNVKYSTTVPYYLSNDEHKNIILETGTYDFYFNPTENKVHIEGEVKKAVTVYLDINGKDWNNGRVALYYYKGDVTRWVSAIACDGDNNIYYAQIPRGFDTYIWVKLKKDTDNSWDNKEKTEDQTVNIKLNSQQNLAILTDDKDGEWHLNVELDEYTGYCKQEFPIEVQLLNDPQQDGTAWKLDAQYEGTAVIEEYGFFINRSLEKGGVFVTENLNAGKVAATVSAENEKIFEGKASYNLLPGYWHAYRAYVKVNGEYSLSTTTKWFLVENTCTEYKYETNKDSVLVHINSNVAADPCNFVFNSFEQAFAVLRSVGDVCEVTTEKIGTVDQDVIKLIKPVIMLVHFAAQPYRGSEEIGVSGGHINDAPAIFFRNINMEGSGEPLIVRTADPNGNRAVIVHPVIRRSTNITLDNLDIISDSNLRDNAIDIDTGEGENNLEGLNKDFNLVALSEIDHKITLKNSKYISYGRNCIHVVGIKGLYVENNEFYTKYDFTANISEGADVIDWGGTIKFINVTDVKFLRNNSEGTLATSFFLQGCQRILLMNNVFWNDNAVAVPDVASEGRSVANVRLVSYTVNIADAAAFPLQNIGIYYNTFFIKNNDAGAGSYHKFDFFRLGGKEQPVGDTNKAFYDPTTIRFQYNNCYSYDEDITGNNDDEDKTSTFYLQGIGKSTDWCQCFVYNNFWSKYDKKEEHSSSSFELGKYCTGGYETYNLYTSVDEQVCNTDPQQPGSLVVKGDAWNIGTVIKNDVSLQGADQIFNDRLNPDNGVNSIRPQMAVDNSNEALSPYDKIYLEPGSINLFTSPIVGSQTTDVHITSIKLTPNTDVNLMIEGNVCESVTNQNDEIEEVCRFALTDANGQPITSLKTDADGSLDNEPVYITFVRPKGDDAKSDKEYEAFLIIVPDESASADEQLLLRIPLRGHHKANVEKISGAWTVGAFQQRDPKPVDKIIWHGLTSDEWDNRNNWYKEDGTLVTCLDALTEDLTVIIPAKDSEKYLTPVQGVVQYPILPKIASEEDFKDNRQDKWKGEQVNAGNSGKVAKKIVMEYGAALVGVEELGQAVRYTEVEQEFVARRNDWLLVGTVVKPWDVDEEGNQISRNVISNDYYLYHLPHVYMHEAKVVVNDENEVTAEWQTSFANLDVEVPQDRAFAIRIPDQYGPKKFPAEVYNRREDTNYNANEAIRYTFTGRFYNESSLPTYSLLQQGEPVILTNTYPANIDAQKLQAGKGNGEGSVQYYDYDKKAFIPLGSDAKSIMSQHSFIFTPKAELARLKVERDYFQTTETGHRSASADIQDFRVELINRADNTASEIYVRYDELKEDAIDYAVDAPKVFNSMESTLGDLYVMRYDRKWAGLSISTMSEPIPLGVKVSTADKAFTFSLGASNIEEDIILEDRQTGAQYNLSKGENYRVEGLQVGKCEGRFYLMLSENEEEELPEDGDEITTDAEDTESLANGIDIFTQENSIVVSCNSEMELMQVVVSDVAGRHQVYSVSGQYVKLDLPVSTGVYTISVIGDKATRVEKIKLN